MDLNPEELLDSLRAAQARQTLVLHLLQGQRKTSDPDAIMRAAAAGVGQYLQADRVGFFETGIDDSLDFTAGWTAGRLPLLAASFPAIGIGARYLAEVRAGRTLGIADTRSDPLTAGSVFPEVGTLSLIGVPIIRNHRWHAGFYVNHSEVRHWTAEEIDLVRNVGELTWDAVERVRATSALQKSEERLNLALQASGAVGTWDWDLPGDRVFCDAHFAWLFSLHPARAAAGAPLADYLNGIHPDDRARVASKIQLALETGSEYSEEFRVLPQDGSVRWVHARGRCRRDADGRPIRFPGVVIDVTERKQAEITLHAQWNTFDTALSHTPDFAFIFDLAGRFTYANRSLLALYQMNLDQVVGKDFFDLGYPADLAARLQRQIGQVIDTRKSLRDETPFTGVSGDTRFYEYIFVPVLASDGQVEAVAGSTRDITERNQAEELLEQDRRRWRDLLLQAPAGIALLSGPQHRFAWVNLEYTRLVAYPADRLVGKTVLEVFPEVEDQVYMDLLNNVYQTGQPFVGREVPLHLDAADGTPQDAYVNFVYAPTRNTAGEIDGIFVHVTDVTSTVVARQRVQESEQRFHQLADSMPQFVWTARPDGTLDYCNERWYQFTGFECSPAAQPSWDALLHPDERQRVHDTWLASVRSGDAYKNELRFWDRRENRWRWFMSNAVAARDSHGAIAKWFGTTIDIDEQKISQQALLQTQKLESIGLLAGGIAHDFNNLLVGILGGASFALEILPPGHPAYEMLQNVVDSSERAAHLTRQMLAYAGKGRFIIKPVDLSELATETVRLVSGSIPKSVVVTLQLDRDLPAVESDPGQMQQLVMNLILNAAEAVGDNQGFVTVRTRSERLTESSQRRGIEGSPLIPGLYVVFEVEDTGTGIDPSTLTKIFDPFFTTKFTGRGLGLAAVAGVVRSHQGGVEVESELGRGATFRVLLPASKARPVVEAPVPSIPKTAPRATILVVDDEPMVRQVTQAALERSGYRAIVAETGDLAMQRIRRDPAISLVLLDMSMPGLSGRGVLTLIQALRTDLPVVICSGYSEDEVLRQFSGLEIAGVLPKPFTTAQLTAQIQSVLDASKQSI